MEQPTTNLISYCGFYCAACPTLIKGKCEECKGDSPNVPLDIKLAK